MLAHFSVAVLLLVDKQAIVAAGGRLVTPPTPG